MTTYKLSVLSPDGEIFNGDVISLLLRGADGDICILAGHIPLITTVKPGRCVITLPDEEENEGELKAGILDVGKDNVKLIVGNDDAFADLTPGGRNE